MLRERDVKTPETPSVVGLIKPDTPHASRKADLTNLIIPSIATLPLVEFLVRNNTGVIVGGLLGTLVGRVIHWLYKDVTATVDDYGREDNVGELKFACVGGIVGATIVKLFS